jgi:hypothetical protein
MGAPAARQQYWRALSAQTRIQNSPPIRLLNFPVLFPFTLAASSGRARLKKTIERKTHGPEPDLGIIPP